MEKLNGTKLISNESANSYFIEWKKEINDIKHIMFYLNSYDGIEELFNKHEFIREPYFLDHINDWFSQFVRFEGLEKEFYQKHWCPIEATGYKFFIDMSTPSYPLIEIMYILKGRGVEKYQSKILFDSISDLLMLIDKPFVLKDFLDKNLLEKNYDYFSDVDSFEDPYCPLN